MKKITLGSSTALISVLALTGCGNPDQSPPPPTVTASPADDILGQNACQNFRIMISDAHKGVLTDADVRTRIQGIYTDGQYAKTKIVADASTVLLSADTTGNAPAVASASNAMDLACGVIGQ